ncbi:MAG: hypothetical protein LBT14_00830 [Treponema sp.]|nr:hypothetical protein [Treponema sp.]
MKRVIFLFLLSMVFGMVTVSIVGAAPPDPQNNEYYLESVRLLGLARESFDYGDYDAATAYATEAMKYARMSDEYVAQQLKIQEADDAIARAKERLDWATSMGAKTQFTAPYNRANSAYSDALKAKTAEKWTNAVDAAHKVIAAVAEIEALQAKQADDALAAAKKRLDWATSIGAKTQFPTPYNQANSAYNDAVKAQNAKKFSDVVPAANKVMAAVAEIEALQAKQADDAIAAAKKRLDWATSIGAKTQFPEPYTKAGTAYNEALKSQTGKQWDDAMAAAGRVIAAIAEIENLKTQQDAAIAAAAAAEAEGLKAQEAANVLAAAKERLDWATSIGAKTQFPTPYKRADSAYTDGVKAQNGKNWNGALAAADKVMAAVAEIEALQAKQADDALAAAKKRLDWATSIGAKTQFPTPYKRADSAYTDGVKAQNVKKFGDVITATDKVLAAVAEIETLQAKQADDAITAAKKRLDWATSIGAKTQFPTPYMRADSAYTDAVKAQSGKGWDDAIAAAGRVIAAVAEIENLKTQQDAAIAAAAAAEAERLKAQEVADALAAAKERLDWATSMGAKTQFPNPYKQADSAYTDGVKAQNGKNWNGALTAADKVIAAVAEIETLKAKEANDALAAAKARLDWATSIGAKTQFPTPYTRADSAYTDGVKAQNVKQFGDVMTATDTVLAAVAEIEALKAQEAAAAIAAAKERLDWAASIGGATRFPGAYTKAGMAYHEALDAQAEKDWDDAIAAAGRVMVAVAELDGLKAAEEAAAAAAAIAAAEKFLAEEAAREIAAAKERLDWAAAIGGATLFPDAYTKARTAYNEALDAQAQKKWDDAIAAAGRVIATVAEIEGLKAQYEAAERRKAQEAADAIAAAKERLDWAALIGAATQFPDTFTRAENAYREALDDVAKNDKDGAIAAAQRVVAVVGEIERLKANEANDRVAAAKERLDWAASVAADIHFPDAFAEAQGAYTDAGRALSANDWVEAIIGANQVMTALAPVHAISPLPAQYLVRTWASVRDCLWNIAGYPWVYNDPTRWRLLYDANRSKLPDIDNPNFILPAVVLDIPSIRGEVREGLWDEQGFYEPLP